MPQQELCGSRTIGASVLYRSEPAVSQIPNWILSSESSSGTGACKKAAPTVVTCSALNELRTKRSTSELLPTLESPSSTSFTSVTFPADGGMLGALGLPG